MCISVYDIMIYIIMIYCIMYCIWMYLKISHLDMCCIIDTTGVILFFWLGEQIIVVSYPVHNWDEYPSMMAGVGGYHCPIQIRLTRGH